jgi:hypothetical protein
VYDPTGSVRETDGESRKGGKERFLQDRCFAMEGRSASIICGYDPSGFVLLAELALTVDKVIAFPDLAGLDRLITYLIVHQLP